MNVKIIVLILRIQELSQKYYFLFNSLQTEFENLLLKNSSIINTILDKINLRKMIYKKNISLLLKMVDFNTMQNNLFYF